jgi:hypothetical protein
MMTMTETGAATDRAVRIAGRSYPVVLPTVRDPRLHLASVIITVHVLGVATLGFQVSVPQILSAIAACAAIEVAITLRRTGALVWPASAMLTGSGVALIFRVLGTERGDIWSWHGWYLFAGVAGLSLLTKYAIRHRGSHVFNPSNVGLVVAFLILGSERVAPLDFWWAPLDLWMAATYIVILVGGLLITARLRLLAMAGLFWVTLAAGLGVLAASDHCFTAAWSLQPVCGSQFWWVVVTSPEVLIFLFFMITDPRTIPIGAAGRLVFAAAVAIVATLLIAPQTTEFGAKVGLLAGLAVLSPARWLIDRALPERLGVLGRLTMGKSGPATPRQVFTRGSVAGAAAVFLVAGIAAAGTPAREPARAPSQAEAPQLDVDIDASTLPPVTVSADAASLNSSVAADPSTLAVALAEALVVEGEAMQRVEPSLLRSVDAGARLNEMETRIAEAVAAGELVVSHYAFRTLHLDVVFTSGSQGGASLALEAGGDVEEVVFDARGVEQRRTTSPFGAMFVMQQSDGGRWLLVEARS